MVYWFHRTLKFASKYRAEITISVVSTIFGVILAKVAETVLSASNVDQLILGLLGVIALFLAILAFVIKRNITSRVAKLQQKVSELVGRALPSQYDERKTHFAEEKSRLIELLVKIYLPTVIKKLLNNRPDSNFKIAVLVDSGTTLDQFFPRIKLLGMGDIQNEAVLKRVELYTNSLSGSDAFCKESASTFSEHQLHLFGGTQMEKYRAVTGEVTLKAMNAVRDEYRKTGGVIIGLITANWFLVGTSYNKLVFCSSESSHLDYKQHLAEISDELIVVTPLAKLLTLDSTDELNNMLKLGQEGKLKYEGFDLPAVRKQQNTYLMTTYRNWRDSVLFMHSEKLRDAFRRRKHNLYTLCEGRCLLLDHRVSRQEQREIEMPHAYLREYSLSVLQFQ